MPASSSVKAPYKCIFCNGTGPFTSDEHIVPHSLGNDLVVLAPGWVCDLCNNICSAFESRALSSSILGLERCRLGVTTKKKKPAKSVLYGTTWFAESTAPENIVSVESDWSKTPVLWNEDGSGKIAFRLHDKTNLDISRLLLKIGLELLAVRDAHNDSRSIRNAAIEFVLNESPASWPYFVLFDKQCKSKLTSIFDATPDAHEYIQSCSFDLYLHEVEGEEVLFFEYGQFFSAISVTSPTLDWAAVLKHWKVPHVGCPIEFSHVNG